MKLKDQKTLGVMCVKNTQLCLTFVSYLSNYLNSLSLETEPRIVIETCLPFEEMASRGSAKGHELIDMVSVCTRLENAKCNVICVVGLEGAEELQKLQERIKTPLVAKASGDYVTNGNDTAATNELESFARYCVDLAVGINFIGMNSERVEEFWKKRADELQNNEIGVLQSTMLTKQECDAKERDRLEKQNLLAEFTPFLNEGCRGLEFGCGTGRWTIELAPLLQSLESFDFIEAFVSACKKRLVEKEISNVQVWHGELADLDLTKTFDVIFSIGFLNYLSERQFQEAFNTIKTVLSPNGIVVFKESMGSHRRFELHGFYSEELNCHYDAIYRTTEEFQVALGEEFKLLRERVNLVHGPEKSETCQKILVFQKSGSQQ